MKFEKICVLGMGYIGLPTAGMFASRGKKVVGVDTNPDVIQALSNGLVHIYEPGLKELIEAPIKSSQFIVRRQPEEADAFIIAVPTPFKENKKADLDYVIAATESILPYLRKGNLVVLESTSPPLTTEKVVAPVLERNGLIAGRDFHLAYSPERVLPGQILRELIDNARVIGGVTLESAEMGRKLYRLFVKGQIFLTTAATAEMVKLMENTYRDVNIAVANEFSRLADRFGVNLWEAIELANQHPRVQILTPGAGVGGHCIGVDPWFLAEAAPDLTPLIQTARQVNDSQPQFVVDLVRGALGGSVVGRRITALGLAYKPNVDDLRESPAVEVCRLLSNEGCHVTTFEPYRPGVDFPGMNKASTFEEAVKNAEAVLCLVRHDQFVNLDPDTLREITSARIAVDVVNAWEPAPWKEVGYQFVKMGDGNPIR